MMTRPLMYSSSLFLTLFILLFIAWGSSEIIGPARWQKSPDSEKKDRGSSVLLACTASLGTILFFVSPLLLPSTTIQEPWEQVGSFVLGIIVVLLGGWLRWAAIKALGNRFTGSIMVAEKQHIVQSGPYKHIRHPSYAGILTIVLGFGFMATNWVSLLAITVGMLLGLLYRMHVEERALSQLPGYTAYMQQTKRFIPSIY